MSQPVPKSRRRWFQYGLRTLLVVVTLVVAGLVAWRAYIAPYEQQRQTMLLVERLGGGCETKTEDKWGGRFYHDGFKSVTRVDLTNCDDPARYIDAISRLPKLEILVVGGNNFTDDHLRRLHRISSLQGLVLDCTNVTDTAIAELERALPKLDIFQSYRRAWQNFKYQPIKSVRFGEIADTYKGAHKDLRQRVDYSGYFMVIAAFNSTRADDADLRELARIWTLEELVLDNTEITDAGLAHLPQLKGLAKLSVVGTKVTPQGIAKLRQALPKCEIRN